MDYNILINNQINNLENYFEKNDLIEILSKNKEIQKNIVEELKLRNNLRNIIKKINNINDKYNVIKNTEIIENKDLELINKDLLNKINNKINELDNIIYNYKLNNNNNISYLLNKIIKNKTLINSECPICYTNNVEVCIDSCGHLFCNYCINKNIINNIGCPLCRRYIDSKIILNKSIDINGVLNIENSEDFLSL